ncbi:BrnT family toxin [Nostoc sp.]
MKFEWDKNKNKQNIYKHGINFEEATEIFDGVVFTSINERYNYE